MCLLWFYSALPFNLQHYNWLIIEWKSAELLETHYPLDDPIRDIDRREVIGFEIDEHDETVRCYVK